jgi:hypothetical protein
VAGRPAEYRLAPSVPQGAVSYGGTWTLSGETATVGPGHGRIAVTRDAKPFRSIDVDGARLYTVVSSRRRTDAVLEFFVPAGVRAYSFTFG